MTPHIARQADIVAIIGAGVSGLAAGCFLARNGFAVKVLEANSKVGGCCATTTLKGYTFNDGAVYLPLVNVLDHGFARLGLVRDRVLPLRKIGANFSARLPDGAVVTLGDGMNLSVEGHAVDKARLECELKRLVERWQPFLRLLNEEIAVHPFSAWRMLRKGWRQALKLRGTVASELRRAVTDDAVRAALSGALLYSGQPPEKLPTATLIGLVAMMNEGFYLPEGGMGRIPDVLGTALQRLGGEVVLNSKVERIVMAAGRASAVDSEGQGRVEARAIISTTSAMSTYTSLLEPRNVPAAMLRKVETARLSHQSVSLQFGLSNRIKTEGHLNMVLPELEQQREIFAQKPTEVKWPIYFVPTLTLPELAPPGGSVIEMFHPVAADVPLSEWDEEKREALTLSAIRRLREVHALDIVVTRVRTPQSLSQSLHLYRGALYGLSPNAGPREQFGHRTPIPGLYLAGGQSAYPGYGVATSMMSGILAAEALMKGFNVNRKA